MPKESLLIGLDCRPCFQTRAPADSDVGAPGAHLEKLRDRVNMLTVLGLVFALTSKEKEQGQKVKPAPSLIPPHIRECLAHLSP